jgi:catechol 2,3-dioxygenase-like lactoylglutathione lyase family enzyme
MITLAYTNIFTADIDRLADFYGELFGLQEIMESRSPLFRGFTAGGSSIGFSAPGAYELLGLAPQEGQATAFFRPLMHRTPRPSPL